MMTSGVTEGGGEEGVSWDIVKGEGGKLKI